MVTFLLLLLLFVVAATLFQSVRSVWEGLYVAELESNFKAVRLVRPEKLRRATAGAQEDQPPLHHQWNAAVVQKGIIGSTAGRRVKCKKE